MKFIDQASLLVKAGDGGMGCIAFLREKFRPKGGPCGGDGGHGGSVIFSVNPQLSTLQDIALKTHYRAENGAHGGGKNMHGRNGADIIIQVPPGTIIKNSLTHQILKDLINPNESFVAAKGGNGGFGNARFKSRSQTAPRIANDGQRGEETKIDLELKVLADVGLVGFPNAGKSTFISKVSNAKPKIADYPFTTLTPNLGIVKYGEYNSFVIADIPGLIQGASAGKGLGNQFLRHVERTKVLVYLIEALSEDIEKDFLTLRTELEKHDADMVKRPSMILITKMDIIQEPLQKLKKIEGLLPILSISAVSGENLPQAIRQIALLIESYAQNIQSPAD